MILTVYTVFLYFTFRKWLVESPSDPNVMAFNPRYEHAIYTSCIVISLYINAFIAYEIYVLLKNSKMRRHTNPPTFKKVLCECGIAYTPGVIVFIVDKVLTDRLRQRDQTGDTTLGLCYIFYVAIPISFLICICFQIWYNKLLPAKSMNLYGGRLRILALYFGRIVFVEFLVWLPAIIMFGSYSFQNLDCDIHRSSFNISLPLQHPPTDSTS